MHWHNQIKESKSSYYSINEMMTQSLCLLHAMYMQNRPGERPWSMLHFDIINRQFKLEAVAGPRSKKDKFTASNKLYAPVPELVKVWDDFANGTSICLRPKYRFVVFERIIGFKAALPDTLTCSQFSGTEIRRKVQSTALLTGHIKSLGNSYTDICNTEAL